MSGHDQEPAVRRIDFVGLGQIGLALATNARLADFDVRGVDPAETARSAATARGIPCVATLEALAGSRDCIALCLPGPDHVAEVVGSICSLGLAERPRYVVNLSTIGPDWAERIDDWLRRESPETVFVEAPVSGGVLRTAAREIALLCGCRDAARIEPVRPLLNALAKRVFVFGSVRDASVAKLVNNIAAVNIALGTLEALGLGVASGLALEDLFDVLDAGTAGSYVLSSTLRRPLIDGDVRTGFAMRLAAKDMRLALAHGASLGVELPHAAEALAQLREGVEAGLGDLVFPAVALERTPPPASPETAAAPGRTRLTTREAVAT